MVLSGMLLRGAQLKVSQVAKSYPKAGSSGCLLKGHAGDPGIGTTLNMPGGHVINILLTVWFSREIFMIPGCLLIGGGCHDLGESRSDSARSCSKL
jgi:hypothetical protein